MGIADDEADAVEAACLERAQEVGPEGLGLGGPDSQADDLATALGIGGHRDYGGDRHDTAALANLQIGRVEPDIGPLAGERPVEELPDALVDVPAEL